MGGVSKLFSDKQTSKGSSTSQIKVGAESDQERFARTLSESSLKDLEGLIGKGPGEGAITAAGTEANTFAEMLRNLQSRSGFADENQISQAQQFASKVFAPQQEALNQSFEDQATRVSRLAAQRGRPVNDPILQAKLAQEQTRQQSLLSAQQGGFAAQAAQGAVQQQVGLGEQLFNLRQGLATQALQNRQTLLSLGSQVQQAGRQFRLATGKQIGRTSQTQTQSTGLGNIAIAAGGTIFGAAGAAGGFGNLFGSGGSASPLGGGSASPLGGGSGSSFQGSTAAPRMMLGVGG